MDNILKLVSVNDLFGMKFRIPGYQRGYRWTDQQVRDLLNDINEFLSKSKGSDEIYCIQPLVVKHRDEDTFKKIKEEAQNIDEIKALLKGAWDVVDGQQRLTTLHIILSYLSPELKDKYSIEYETRTAENQRVKDVKLSKGSKEFLEEIANKSYRESEDFNKTLKSNIDFYHIANAYHIIETWFEEQKSVSKENFLDTLIHKVKFIWYETTEQDPIKVFTRLNIGKIPLTDSELIKALFLNRSNFREANSEQIRLQQIEIASEWDEIETTLQNDEFWLFCNNPGWEKPTRIDLIFDMMCEDEVFGTMDYANLGNDGHKTFRYFYKHFNDNRTEINTEWIRNSWVQVKTYFQIMDEWYNDLELYHYSGFLIEYRRNIKSLIDLYKMSDNKEQFKIALKQDIAKIIRKCLPPEDSNHLSGKVGDTYSTLDFPYGNNGENKGTCRPILLLHNIQTIINQNMKLCNSEKYESGIFYKFPFHLFKKEKWDVEHIASNAGDSLESLDQQQPWLASIVYYLPECELKSEIVEYIAGTQVDNDKFRRLKSKIDKLDINPLKEEDQQKIRNFTLLDASTKREYHNDPFAVKRICVLAKEQGYKAIVAYDKEKNSINIDKSTEVIAFVPPCTKNIFIKAYTDVPSSMGAWSEPDAVAYLRNIEQVLIEFIYPEISSIPAKLRPALSSRNRLICNISKNTMDRYMSIIRTMTQKQENN